MADTTALLKGLAKGIRLDGRGLLEYRPISIMIDVSKSAEGSARVRFGKTDVIVGVKLGVEKPYPDTPEQGNLMFNVELLAMSNPEYEPGPPDIEAIELARVVDRGIREAKAIDQKDLCITPAEKVWSVMVDICSMNDEGGLMDASALCAIAALKNARFPKYEDEKVDYLTKTDKHLPLKREPIAITVFKIGPHLIVDPLEEEEEAMTARLTLTITENNTICAAQKGGDEPLSPEDIDKIAKIAVEKAAELRKALSEAKARPGDHKHEKILPYR